MAWKLRKDKIKSDEPEAQDAAAPGAESAQTPAETTDGSFQPLGTPLGFDLSANASHPAEPAPATEPEFEEDAPPQFAEEDLPRFVEETPSFHISTTEGADTSEDESEEKEPISLGAFAPYQPPPMPDPVVDLEPLPDFDPIVAPSTPALEPEAVEMAPLVLTHDSESAAPAEAVEEVAPPIEAAITPAEEPLEFAEEPESVIEEPSAPEDEPVFPAEEPQAAPEEPLTFADDEIPAVPHFDVSPEREAAAPGLVSTESETGLPRVAPFILDTPDTAAPSEPDRMHHIVLRMGNLSASYILVKDVTTIGRPDSAVQNYPDIEVELDDGVSRRHAEIRRQNDQFFVVDMDSTNGTILNGEMLTPDQPVPLRPGDRIRIGERTEMLFE